MVNSTLSVVIRSATTGILAVVSGSRSHLWLYQHDNLKSGSVFDILKEHNADNAAYNSRERELEHAFTCQEGTRRDVIAKISAWSKVENGPPICWLRGPAGSGKSTVAHTIAAQCDHNQRLAFSFFFSRGKLDRSETTKFIPTFAYQLAKFFPAIQTSMQQALAHDPSILSQRLGDQIKKLIIYPVVIMTEPVAPMIVVIDGLDECGEKDSLQELVRLLVDSTNQCPFRFLFTSRPEPHIERTFESPSTKCKAYFLSLSDFSATDDIRSYLRLHLSEIREKEPQLMRDVPKPWPSQRDLEILVEQSEGLFIYVSTLVGFIGDGNGLPQNKLQVAMKVHKGVDPLYDHVLSEARKYDNFEQVIGAIVYLRRPLTISELGWLLQLESSSIRLALRGCQSIFTIPGVDSDSVRPYHASLRDFLTDGNRAKSHFLHPMKHHAFILVDCLKSMAINLENSGEGDVDLEYAHQNWCHHFSLALLHHGEMGVIESKLSDIEMFMRKLKKQWLKLWIYRLADFDTVSHVCEDFNSVLAKMMVCLMFSEFGSAY